VTSRPGPGRSEYVPRALKYRSPSKPFPGTARTRSTERIGASAWSAMWIDATVPVQGGTRATRLSRPRSI